MTSASTSVWEKAALPALVLMQDNSASPSLSLVPFELLPQHWAWREHVQISLCGPFKRNTWTAAALYLIQPQFLLVFTIRIYGNFSSWILEPWAGELGVGLGPLTSQEGPPQLRYLPWFLSNTHGCGTGQFRVFTLLSSLDVASSSYP